MARLLTRRGNRVGAMLYGRGVERTIPAGSGRVQVLRLIEDLPGQPRHAGRAVHDLGAAPRGGRTADQTALAWSS